MSESTSPEIEIAAGLADEVVTAHQADASSAPGQHGSLLVWMLTLALPVLLEESLNLMVGFTDRFLAGWYLGGPEPQAAMGLMMYAMWMLFCFFSAVAVGGTALTARFVGAGSWWEARLVVGQAILAGTVLAIVVTTLAGLFGNAFLHLLGATGETAVLSQRYLWYLTPVIPIIMLEQVGSACLRGAGDTVTGLIARAVVNVVNVVLSICLVTGWGPFPQLNWEGLAVGTAVGHAFGGLIVLAALLRGRKGLRLEAANLRPHWPMMRRLLWVGIPGGVDMLVMVACHLLYLMIIAALGTVALAAHSLGIQIEALSFLAGSAFQVAAATMAGQALGANDPQRARQSVLWATSGAVLVMAIAGCVFYFGGETLTSIFTGGKLDETSQEAGKLMQIVAFSVVPMAILIVLSGTLRNVGDTRWNLCMNAAALIVIRLPLAMLLGWEQIPIPGTAFTLPGLGWGVEGVWLASVADVVIRCVAVTWRFFQGGWMKVKV